MLRPPRFAFGGGEEEKGAPLLAGRTGILSARIKADLGSAQGVAGGGADYPKSLLLLGEGAAVAAEGRAIWVKTMLGGGGEAARI